MKTILVLAPNPELVEALRGGLNPEQYRVLHRTSAEDAEPLLAHGLAQVCILDAELTGVQGVWVIEKLRRRAAAVPLIVCAAARQPEWEEEAYLHGVSHVLVKPVRPRMIATLLDRMFAGAEARGATPTAFAPPPPVPPITPPAPSGMAVGTVLANIPVDAANAPQTLALFRDFSSILTHSLDSEALVRQFLLLLRQILSVNRAAVFLRHAGEAFGGRDPSAESRRLRSVCALGLNPDLLAQFELSLDTGIGGQLQRHGRILRRHSDEARADPEAQKEFDLLGAQVAVPMLDRHALIGVAVFDGRVTGEPLVNTELELIFHLLEQVGLAVRNIHLHDQLAAGHAMMAGVLRELSSACVVVNRDLKVLHANKTARKYLGTAARSSGEMEFADLPQPLANKVYQVLRTGAAVAPFKYEPPGAPAGAIFSVSVVPFQRQDIGTPVSALLTVEDLTQSEQLRRLEVEAANLRLLKVMADRLAHEVGNALVPLSTHQQLLAEKFRDPEFRASLDVAMAEAVKRVTRLTHQMRFLARDTLPAQEAFPMAPLIEEAYAEARKYQPAKAAHLSCENGGQPAVVTGDRAALKHALTEVMINALQANPADPKIGVRVQADPKAESPGGLQIEVQDNGTGFTAEAAQNASAPFFTTRNVGLGLGLAVSRKIVEIHRGKLEIVPPKPGRAGVVRISLPAATPQPPGS